MSLAVCLDLELDGDTILCAATAWTNGFMTIPQLWVEQTKTGFAPLGPKNIELLLDFLVQCKDQGMALVTWGGTNTDWRMLHKAVGDERKAQVKELAMYAVDIPLLSSAANGMMMGLTAVAQGMGLGKRPACDSQDVPNYWNSGDAKMLNDVFLHVQWDASTCAAIYNRLTFNAQFQRPLMTWMTVRGQMRSVRLQREKTQDGSYKLPRVADLILWEPPTTNFRIPEHLHPKTIIQWLL